MDAYQHRVLFIALVLLAFHFTQAGAQPATQPSGGAVVSKSTPPIPLATITVDGDADEWANIPVYQIIKPGVTSSYRPAALSIAMDDKFLYVLLKLGTGVRERFDQQTPSGRVSSGALGYLNLNIDGVQHRVWLPTGFTMKTRKGNPKPSFSLEMSYELARQSKDGKKMDDVLTKQYPVDKGFIGIAGKYVEFKIPLDSLLAKPASTWVITFNPF